MGSELTTTLVDRALHLVMFVAAAAAIGLGALAVIERLGESSRKAISIRAFAIAAGVTVALFVTERLYHALS
ncbi:MAG: hypothetical protein WD646_04035 [Actinomycetota bacterium]